MTWKTGTGNTGQKELNRYWLLDNFLERSKDFASWYYSHLYEEEDRLEETIPYIDPSLFETGPENHIFIGKGIRSIGLFAKKQTLFTTNNPEIPLDSLGPGGPQGKLPEIS